jgi:hypothetical protein
MFAELNNFDLPRGQGDEFGPEDVSAEIAKDQDVEGGQ